jgi:hypothetical protein
MSNSRRISIYVDSDIDKVREHLLTTTGVRYTYVQLFDHLIHFYMKNAKETTTEWRPK